MGRYGLPPSHPAFRRRTFPDVLEEFLVDRIHLRGDLVDRLTSGDLSPEERRAIQDQVRAIDALLDDRGDEGGGDPLVELWEAQMAAGLDPDLDLTVEDLRR